MFDKLILIVYAMVAFLPCAYHCNPGPNGAPIQVSWDIIDFSTYNELNRPIVTFKINVKYEVNGKRILRDCILQRGSLRSPAMSFSGHACLISPQTPISVTVQFNAETP